MAVTEDSSEMFFLYMMNERCMHRDLGEVLRLVVRRAMRNRVSIEREIAHGRFPHYPRWCTRLGFLWHRYIRELVRELEFEECREIAPSSYTTSTVLELALHSVEAWPEVAALVKQAREEERLRAVRRVAARLSGKNIQWSRL